MLLEGAGQFRMPHDVEASYGWLVDAMLRGASAAPE